ncbi:MAG TPA: hypothetical protein VFJ82_24555 [Longimicrobium sp.]|nr:hypothetical protein [Longimicrobium sp.]
MVSLVAGGIAFTGFVLMNPSLLHRSPLTSAYLSFFVVSFIPFEWVRWRKRLLLVIEEIRPLAEKGSCTFGGFRDIHVRLSIGVRNWPMMLCGLLVCVLGTVTLKNDPKYNYDWLQLTSFQLPFFVCGCAAYGLLFFFWFQHILVREPLRPQFLNSGKNAIRRLTEVSLRVAVLTFAGYVGLFIAVCNCSPRQFGSVVFPEQAITPTVPWLRALALFPFLTMVLGMTQVHHFQKELKAVRLRALGAERRRTLGHFSSTGDLSIAKGFFELENQIDSSREWPVNL